MRSPLQPRVARPLALGRELAAVAVAGGGVCGAFGLGWLAGPLPASGSLEWRAAWVLALAALGPGIGWVMQNESSAALRFLPLVSLVVPLAHLAVPSSALVASADVCVLLAAACVVLCRAIFRVAIRQHRSAARTRLIAVALGLALPGPLFTLGWGLTSSIVIPGVIRAFHRSPPPAPAREEPAFIETDDGLTLAGGYTRGDDDAPGVVLVHGYADGRSRMAGWAELLASRGAHVLRFDHRAAGLSDGTVCTFADREARDVAAAVRWLRTQPGVDASRVGALGASMGGGVILAALPLLGEELHAMALLAPASDYRAIVSRRLPPEPLLSVARAMIWGVPRAMGHASPLSLVPMFGLRGSRVRGVVVHSRADRTILPALTEALLEVRPGLEIRWLEHAAHDQTPRAAREDPEARAAILRVLLGGDPEPR